MTTSYDLSDLGATQVHDLSDLGGAQVTQNQALQTNPSFLPRVGADALAGLAQMGNGILNTPHNIANAISPSMGAKVPGYLPNYNYGQALGVNNPNVGDKLIQGAAQYAPYMMGGEAALATKAADSIPSLMARLGVQSAAGGAFGATQSQDPAKGAAIGAALGAGGELVPAGLSATAGGIGKAFNAVRPQKYAEQLLSTLGGGNTLEGNAQSLAKDIQGAYKQKVDEGAALYSPVFNQLGDNSIYSAGNSTEGAYKNVANELIEDKSYDRNLNKLHQQFTDEPTLNNAHALQSQLGSSIRKLQTNDARGNLSVADRSKLQGYQDAQGGLRSDINSFLTSENPALADQYNAATANWAQNVTPYLDNSKLTQIAKGGITNPKNITSLFAKPEPEIQQIVDDIGPQAANKILYSQLGKRQANLTPESLANAFSKLDENGLGSYVTPSLQQQFEQLAKKTTMRDYAQRAGGLGVGAVLGGHTGLPYMETIGAGLGVMASPLATKLGQFTPRIPVNTQAISSLLAKLYKPTTGAVIANTVNGSSQ